MQDRIKNETERKKGLDKLAENLSTFFCIIGFHNYEKIEQGSLYSLYKCQNCGCENIDN